VRILARLDRRNDLNCLAGQVLYFFVDGPKECFELVHVVVRASSRQLLPNGVYLLQQLIEFHLLPLCLPAGMSVDAVHQRRERLQACCFLRAAAAAAAAAAAIQKLAFEQIKLPSELVPDSANLHFGLFLHSLL